jgi:hypothetical protein
MNVVLIHHGILPLKQIRRLRRTAPIHHTKQHWHEGDFSAYTNEVHIANRNTDATSQSN